MNERIKELESKAWGQVNRTNGLVRTEDFDQKFAELIVKECANISNQAEKQCQHPGTEIKKHFGVKL